MRPQRPGVAVAGTAPRPRHHARRARPQLEHWRVRARSRRVHFCSSARPLGWRLAPASGTPATNSHSHQTRSFRSFVLLFSDCRPDEQTPTKSTECAGSAARRRVAHLSSGPARECFSHLDTPPHALPRHPPLLRFILCNPRPLRLPSSASTDGRRRRCPCARRRPPPPPRSGRSPRGPPPAGAIAIATA